MATVIATLFLLGVAAAIIRLVVKQYRTVAPNEVLVKYGKGVGGDGFKLITGGAAFVIPVIQRSKNLPLDAFQVPVAVNNVPSEEGVLVTVEAIASLKIGTEQELLAAAVRRFLNSTMEQIKNFAKQPLEGCLRGVVATMTVEELVKNRTSFGSKVQEQVGQELAKLGLVVDNFLIAEITDGKGYIEALGVRRTAEVKRDAAIAQADADRDQAIRVAEAQRDAAQKSAEAKKIGETAKALADQQISDAQKMRDVQIATNQAMVKAEQAKIEIAAQIAAAEKKKQLNIAQVAAEEAEVTARTKLQLEEKKRHDAELEASVIVEANRQKEAKIIVAEGIKLSAILTAEGQRRSIEELAAAEQAKREREASGFMEAEKHTAEGRKAQAIAQQAELVAQAEGDKAKLLSIAAGKQAQMLAEAEGQKAQLLAVAVGVAEKAKAYQLLDATGKLLEILKVSPELIATVGQAIKTAGEGTFAPMAQAIGTGIGNVDEIRITNFGGGQSGQDPLSKFMAMIPKSIFNLMQNSQAIPGVTDAVVGIFKKAGIDLSAAVTNDIGKNITEPQITKIE
jgi:flotillin